MSKKGERAGKHFLDKTQVYISHCSAPVAASKPYYSDSVGTEPPSPYARHPRMPCCHWWMLLSINWVRFHSDLESAGAAVFVQAFMV